MGDEFDRIEREKKEFMHVVRNGYLDIARREPHRLIVVKGDNLIESIALEIWNHIYEKFII